MSDLRFRLQDQARICLVLLLPVLILTSSCRPGAPTEGPWPDLPGTEFAEETDPFGYTLHYQRNEAGQRHGRLEMYTPAGQLHEIAHYREGELQGRRVLFQDSGDTLSVEHYARGSFEGPFRSFYPSGQLELEGTYADNRMRGPWRRYYESGALMEVVTFVDNQENGPFTEYHPNGKLKAEGTYLDGDNEHGELLLYDEQGVLERRMRCDRGICRTQWAAENNGNP